MLYLDSKKLMIQREIIEKWKPSGLLYDISTQSDDMLLIAISLEYITFKLIEEHETLDEQLIQLAAPMVVRMYKRDRELLRIIALPVLWQRMKEVFSELDLPEPVGYLASDMSRLNAEVFDKKLYKRLKKN